MQPLELRVPSTKVYQAHDYGFPMAGKIEKDRTPRHLGIGPCRAVRRAGAPDGPGQNLQAEAATAELNATSLNLVAEWT